ncbi:MAG: hypothetical protein JW774_11165 [Candidatus Aureabacteria bacterium]|nr:hypothetical protein [Candidatus Auribacterota bacterium]
MDSNLIYQQNLKQYDIAILLLKARSNSYDDLTPLVPQILKKLKNIQKGQIIKIESWQ